MSRDESIDNAIWDDPEFADLSPNATLLYLWSWTNPRCGMAGLYKVRQSAMTECKVPLEELPAALTELAAANFAFYEGHVMWVRARVKRIRAKSPKMAKSVAYDVEKLPVEHPLRVRFLSAYASAPWLRDALNIPSRNGLETVSENVENVADRDTVSGPSPDGPITRTRTRKVLKKDNNSVSLRATAPDDFPSELRPHLDAVLGVLRAMAERHGAQAVSEAAVAHVLMARPRKPFVKAAHDCAGYWAAKSRPVKDVTAAYRNWLDRTDDLAGVERLNGTSMSSFVDRLPGNRKLDAENRSER